MRENQYDYRIIVKDKDKYRYITKIVFEKNNLGFYVFCPKHKYSGASILELTDEYLIKKDGFSWIPLQETIINEASGNCKISFHSDGFIQVSKGDNKNPVLSGLDENNKPKGVGFHIPSFKDFLVEDGPTFSIGFWGLSGFEEAKKKNLDNSIIFDIDKIIGKCDIKPGETIGFEIQAHLFSRKRLKRQNILEKGGKYYAKIIHTIPQIVINHSIIPFFKNKYFLIGLRIRRIPFKFESETGYIINSPGFIEDGINKCFNICCPPVSFKGKFERNIDFKGKGI